MGSISSIDTVKPLQSPSPTSSPTLEDDIAQTKAWLAHDDSVVASSDADQKGKHRQRHVDLGEDNTELSDTNSYPPRSDQEAETRRVEETLRQWEIAERQRRKAVRESTSSGTIVTSSSLLSDVSRRASLLWRTGRRNPSIGGKHTALSSTDNLDALPLEDIAASPTPTPSSSPTPSPSIISSLRQRSTDPETDANAVKETVLVGNNDTTENPFENPTTPATLEMVSPFADTHQVSAVEDKRLSRPPPPPMPLGLPRPKTPPPVAISTPPYSTNIPDVARSAKDNNSREKPVRWWHEWLCGCGEGTDRGGDYQAGRTNPFE